MLRTTIEVIPPEPWGGKWYVWAVTVEDGKGVVQIRSCKHKHTKVGKAKNCALQMAKELCQ